MALGHRESDKKRDEVIKEGETECRTPKESRKKTCNTDSNLLCSNHYVDNITLYIKSRDYLILLKSQLKKKSYLLTLLKK